MYYKYHFFERGNTDMKIEEYIPPLIRASLDNDLKTIRALSAKIIRNVKQSNPEIAYQISEALNYHGAGLSSTRSIGYTTAPQDKDSRSNLLVIQEPIEMDAPIFDPKIEDILSGIIDERNNIAKLLSVGLNPTSSILLFGEPGVGKTLLAKYFASLFGLKFATLDMSAAVSSYLGKTGQNLKKTLDYAKEEPTLLLLDEFDAIAKKRDDSSDLGELKRVVNVLLKELEEWPAHSILIAATNHPELLDKAIWRRFDITLEVQVPGRETREKLFKENFKDESYCFIKEEIYQALACLTEGVSPADIVKICDKAKKQHIMYDSDISRSLILEIASLRSENSVEFNREFCKIAKKELGMTYREMANILNKSISAIQNYLKGEK